MTVQELLDELAAGVRDGRWTADTQTVVMDVIDIIQGEDEEDGWEMNGDGTSNRK